MGAVMPATILLIKTITTMRPYFFEDGSSAAHTYVDPLLGHTTTSVDLGHLYWNSKLDEAYLANLLAAEAVDSGGAAGHLHYELDVQAVRELGRGKTILGLFSKQMPSAVELMFSFRVISRCVAIASRHQVGFDVHLTRGLISTEYDQYRLADILRAAEAPHDTAVGQCLNKFLSALNLHESPAVTVINLRNDGELNQAILLASIIKSKYPEAAIVLDASGANEQFNFGEWVPLFRASAAHFSRYVDYFLPYQDYKATLRVLVPSLAAGFRPNLNGTENAVCFIDEAQRAGQPLLTVPPIRNAFSDYIKSLPVFYTAGQRTIVGRLSPAKCHWAACKFCTINSQHLMPRGLSVFDSNYEHDFDILARKIRDDNVESLILMDEALHPHVLLAFARALLERKITILYRARCRFTNDLTAEACRLLYASGCRYLGLGLESASPRVNRLVHKHTGPPIEYDRILQNLEDSGIRMHVYAILGFPTERREEIKATRDLLIKNIRHHRYLTVSANLFYLMRGSGIAQQPADFGIERIVDTGDVSLVLRFVEQERSKNQEFAELSAQEIYQAEFLPDIDDPCTAEAFWHFIDQTGVFYVQKVVNPKNPYHELAEVRQAVLPSDFIDLRYESPYLFWLENSSDRDHGWLCDWVTFNYAEIPCWLKEFVFLFHPAVSLRANVEKLLQPDLHQRAYATFRELVQNGLFMQSQTNGLSGGGPPPAWIFRGAAERLGENNLVGEDAELAVR
jgi:hypothetical protein